jgi:hypothetical protein
VDCVRLGGCHEVVEDVKSRKKGEKRKRKKQSRGGEDKEEVKLHKMDDCRWVKLKMMEDVTEEKKARKPLLLKVLCSM